MKRASESDGEPTGDELHQSAEKLRLFDLHALAAFRDEGPSVHIVSDDPGARVVLLSLKAGQGLKEHRTSSLLYIQALQGRVVFTVLEQRVELKIGALMRIESSVLHQVTALSDTVLLLTLISIPTATQPDLT